MIIVLDVNFDIPYPGSLFLMVVKDRVGRKRYILFVVNSQRELSRREIIGVINRVVSDHSKKGGGVLHPWLTVYDGKWGIIRCPHTEKTELISLMTSTSESNSGSGEGFISTVRTSGSIRKLIQLLKDMESEKRPTSGQINEFRN